MRCLSPTTIFDEILNRYVEVPCGKCAACLANRRQEWTCRLLAELRKATSAYFITLTYDDEHLVFAGDTPVLYQRHMQLFFKKLRKLYPNAGIKYLYVGEYGDSSERPHYHLALFNLPLDVDLNSLLSKLWEHGLFHVGNLSNRSAMYTMKYVLKDHGDFPSEDIRSQKPYSPFMRCSKGLGLSWLEENKEWLLHNKSPDGFPLIRQDRDTFVIPRYFKKKLHPKKLTTLEHCMVMLRSEYQKRTYVNDLQRRFGSNFYKVLDNQFINFTNEIEKKKHINNKL